MDVGTSGVAAGSQEQCAQLVRRLPGTVDGQEQRAVSPDGALAAAWGDPAIVLRCGVARPSGLRHASCFEIDGVGWLATVDGVEVGADGPSDGPVTFTTIGLSTYVEVTVPDDYAPQADPLIDLAASISAATRVVRPCV